MKQHKKSFWLHILISTSIFLADAAFSNEVSRIEELQLIMEFDQACIIMHTEGRKYLENKERIAQSYGASALIEQHLEAQLEEYTQVTGSDSDDVRTLVSQKGMVLFNELSINQPKDLVTQCKKLVENIVKNKL